MPSPPPLPLAGCAPHRPLLALLPAERSGWSRGDGAGPGREPAMVYFGVGDEQEREGKSRPWLLHCSEQLPAKCGRMSPRKRMVYQPLFLETVR